MTRRCRALAPSVLAALLLAPAVAAAGPAPREGDETAAWGTWTRFLAFDGTECLRDGDPKAGRLVVSALAEDARRLHLRVAGWVSCAAKAGTYTRSIDYEYEVTGTPSHGYRWEMPGECAWVEVGPLPDSTDAPWRVAVGDPNPVLGGCEVLEGVANLVSPSAGPGRGEGPSRPAPARP